MRQPGSKRFEIKTIFPMKSKQEIYITLESHEWNLLPGKVLYLYINNERIKMKYIASGNMKGDPLIVLVPMQPEDFEKVCEILDENNSNKMNIEFIIDKEK